MASKVWPPKDPDDNDVVYGFDWSGITGGGLHETDNPVVAVISETTTGDVVSSNDEPGYVEDAPDGQGTRHTLNGGTAGTDCVVRLHATTLSGEGFDHSVKIKIKER
jgi:hypothetical protein